MGSEWMKVGDKVIARPPYGPYYGLEVEIIEKLETLDGSNWFLVKTHTGEELISPQVWLDKEKQ